MASTTTDIPRSVLDIVKVAPDAPSPIMPGVFLGSVFSERNAETLRTLGITHILSLTTGFFPSHPDVCVRCIELWIRGSLPVQCSGAP